MIKNGDILCGNLQHLREVYGIYQVQICVGFESILWSLHCGIYEVYSVYNRVCRVYIKVDSPSLLLPLALYLVFSFLSGLFSIFSSFYFFLSSSLSLSLCPQRNRTKPTCRLHRFLWVLLHSKCLSHRWHRCFVLAWGCFPEIVRRGGKGGGCVPP